MNTTAMKSKTTRTNSASKSARNRPKPSKGVSYTEWLRKQRQLLDQIFRKDKS